MTSEKDVLDAMLCQAYELGFQDGQQKKKKFGCGTIFIIWLAGFVLISSIVFWNLTQKQSRNAANAIQLIETKVLYVIDGDTIVVNYYGEDIKVRMIGINTPESVSENEEENCAEGEAAAAYTKSLLEGKTVWLEFDEEKEDVYGRTLAYVWLDKVTSVNYDIFIKSNARALIMENTYCEAAYYEPNGKYRRWYELLEKEYQIEREE